MADSVLRKVVARLEAALAAPELGPADTYAVRGYDVRVLFETIRRYGGRRDWAPTPEAIAELPGPVRRHVLALEAELARQQRLLISGEDRARAAERALTEARKPRR